VARPSLWAQGAKPPSTGQFWLGLQTDYDLDVAEDALGDRLDREAHRHVVTG